MNKEDKLASHKSFCKERQKRIVSAEKRSKHTAVNIDVQKVRQYHIDGDVIASKDVDKCDYLVLNDEKKWLFGHPCGQEMPISPVTKPVPLA